MAEYQSLLEQCEQHIVERNKLSEALQKIAMLADTGSGEYRKEFGTKVVSGWRVAERMREIALEVVGLGCCEWCGGEGQVQLTDEGGNRAWWPCPACRS